MPAPRTYTVVIADDDDMIRKTLGELISDHPLLTLIGDAPDGSAAAELCKQWRPDLVVLDVMMSSGGLEALQAVRKASPETVIAFYTAKSDRRTRSNLLNAGAAAVFAKGAAIDLAEELHALTKAGHSLEVRRADLT